VPLGFDFMLRSVAAIGSRSLVSLRKVLGRIPAAQAAGS
jgi:hypothetical protein